MWSQEVCFLKPGAHVAWRRGESEGFHCRTACNTASQGGTRSMGQKQAVLGFHCMLMGCELMNAAPGSPALMLPGAEARL